MNRASLSLITLAFSASFFVYWLSKVVYRIYFHPLSKFPGPRLAAATTLYRAWYQIVRDGGQLRQWNKLHEQYGQ